MNKKDQIKLITGHAGRLLRSRFGKGPEVLGVALDDRSVVLHFKGFLNPMEDVLLAEKEEKTLRYARELMMKSLVPELQTFFEEALGFRQTKVFYDWNLDDASGVIVALFEQELSTVRDYEGKEEVHRQTVEVLTKTQAKPSTIESWWVDPRTLLIFRRGIAILLEKELNNLGYTDVMKTAKRKVEKRLLWQDARYGRAVRRPLQDLYIDWDFDRDDSIIVCRFDV
ncbi:DUF2294 family protein [Saccharibacillus sp. VR-M41]|uniref:DUF2294 family protein n=2 Tax=Saccharibacillus alkalitolerans TaxID=2705290 RepID=A0ABX0F3W7_9BACL|nr:DUF2294 family protein [Saccharibacillus alkalitolerans]